MEQRVKTRGCSRPKCLETLATIDESMRAVAFSEFNGLIGSLCFLFRIARSGRLFPEVG